MWGRGSSQFGQRVSGAGWRALGSQAPSPVLGVGTLALDSEAGGGGLGFGDSSGSSCWGLIAEHVVITEMTKNRFLIDTWSSFRVPGSQFPRTLGYTKFE